MTIAPLSFALLAALAVGPRPSAAKSTRGTNSAPLRPSTRRPSAEASRAAKLDIPSAKVRRAALRPVADKEGSAALAGLLEAYVNGGGTRFSKSIANKLPKSSTSKAAAQRLLSSIEGAPSRRAAKTLGRGGVTAAVNKKTLTRALAKGLDHGHMVYLMPAIPLEPENVKPPSTFELRHVGMVTNATEDADGTDELTSFVMVATVAEGGDYVIDTVEIGSGQAASVGTATGSKTVRKAPPSDALFISVLIEDDGGNAAQAREEIELLVELASTVATTMPGDDRLVVLHAMIDYTIGLDAVGADPARAARSVVAAQVRAGEWPGFWSADASGDGAVSYKVAVPHTMGSGSYEVLFDVPSTIPDMKTIRLSLSDFTGLKLQPNAKIESGFVSARIKDRSHTYYFEETLPDSFQPIERKVVAGDAKIALYGHVRYSYPRIKGEYSPKIVAFCANAETSAERRKCKKWKRDWDLKARIDEDDVEVEVDIDFAGGEDTYYMTLYSTAIGGFKPATDPKGGPPPAASTTQPAPTAPIRTRTAKGNDIPSSSIKLRAVSW